MLHPDIIVGKSRINGRGLFAKKFIPRCTLLWCLSKNDKIYTRHQYKNLNAAYRKQIGKYIYFHEGKLILLKGNARFWNHSCNSNASHCWDIEFDIALKNIKKARK